MKWALILIPGINDANLTLIPCIDSVIKIWQGNYDVSTYFLIPRLFIPFDTSAIYMWYIIVFGAAVAYHQSVFMMIFVITYFSSFTFYFDAFCRHYRLICHQIEEKINENPRNLNWELESKRKLAYKVYFHNRITESVISFSIF